MPLNVTNYVLTKTILDNAAGREPTEEQKADIGRYSAVAAFAPGSLGLAIPFIARDRIRGDGGENGNGEVPAGEQPNNDEVLARLDRLQASVDASKEEMEGLKSEVETLRKEVDELKSAGSQGSGSRNTRSG